MRSSKMNIELSCDFENEDLLSFISVLERLQGATELIITSINEQYRKEKMYPSIYIGIVILKRFIECINSIKVLALLGMERDASILLLNLIELRLDLMYIRTDSKHADVWLNHEKENEKPWKIGFLFKQLYLNQNEREAEIENYRRFSMAKHGNPVGGLHSFPIEISKRRLIIRDNDGVKDRIAVYLFACGSECSRVCNTVIDIGEKFGFTFNNLKQQIDILKKKIDDLNYNHMKEMVFDLMNHISKPELCGNCNFIPSGVVEISCLLRQANWQNYMPDIEFSCNNYKP